ncbi:hypothetical protein ACA910_009523 [Epithemia clementina (nom. ined.)]
MVEKNPNDNNNETTIQGHDNDAPQQEQHPEQENTITGTAESVTSTTHTDRSTSAVVVTAPINNHNQTEKSSSSTVVGSCGFFRAATFGRNSSRSSGNHHPTSHNNNTHHNKSVPNVAAIVSTTRKVLRGVERQQQRRAAKQRQAAKNQTPDWNAPSTAVSVNDYKTPDELRLALQPDQEKLQQRKQHQQQQQHQHQQHQPTTTPKGEEGTSIPLSGGSSTDHDTVFDSSSWSRRNDDEYIDDEDKAIEWTLKVVDPDTTVPQSMEEELQRLQVLHSYLVLDSDAEAELDRITQLTSQVFAVKTCLVSLVDLGRQWFLSRIGLDATETPRKHAFCAHVIQSQQDMVIVPDATKDIRFCNNPLVADPQGIQIRFYAGAALVTPEGYKLGTLCCIDYTPRPDGLTVPQQAQLHTLAAMVMNVMVARRDRLLRQAYETKLHTLAQQTLHETHQQLERVQTQLQSLMTITTTTTTNEEDNSNHNNRKGFNSLTTTTKSTFIEQRFRPSPRKTIMMGANNSSNQSDTTTTTLSSSSSQQQQQQQQQEILQQVMETLQIQSTILAAARRNIVQETPVLASDTASAHDVDDFGKDRFAGFQEDISALAAATAAATMNDDDDTNKDRVHPKPWPATTAAANTNNIPTTDLMALFDNVNDIVSKYPIHDTVTVELPKGTPQYIVAEDLLLFRCTLNLILHCLHAAPNGPAGLRLKAVNEYGQGPELLVEAYHGPITVVAAAAAMTDDDNANDDKNKNPKSAAAAKSRGDRFPSPRTTTTRMVTAEEARKLFLQDFQDNDDNDNKDHQESLLRPVAVMVRSMGGRFGMFTGRWMHSSNQEGAERPQTIYWFRIPYEEPLFLPSTTTPNQPPQPNVTTLSSSSSSKMPVVRKTLIKTHKVPLAQKLGLLSKRSSTSHSNNKKSSPNQEEDEGEEDGDPMLFSLEDLEKELKEEDPFLAALLEEGCGQRPFPAAKAARAY